MPAALDDVLAVLDRIAPPALAEDWDNVGLIVDATPRVPVQRALLTIDLTEAVLDEAIARRCQLVVAYHPPLFAPLRRLHASDASARVVLRAVREGIAIHSPHTALDAVSAGLCDWLAEALGSGARTPLRATNDGDDPSHGPGRCVVLESPASLDEIVARIKSWLKLPALRIARAPHAGSIRRVALCPGAGGSVLAGVNADLYWTGELRHHDVLAALARGTSVVLCEHSSSERGYLAVLRGRLAEQCPGVEFLVSAHDREPLVLA
ncbi:MAG: Nif3-like dinuclear metal center hexameric protein [Planctomycetes bacterium]|nr:Nif3-like dinuclear metal center hexameric protein [Planctomycetota bacterium]